MKIRFDRLKKLADHLRNGELGHVKFNFRYVHINGDTITKAQKKAGKCGSVGCAIGEMPRVFPSWKYKMIHGKYSEKPVSTVCFKNRIVGDDGFEDMEPIEDFFGLTTVEVEHLFSPGMQMTSWLHPNRAGRELRVRATRKTVATNIDWFIKNNGFRSEASNE